MASTLCMKRMARERAVLEKPNDDFFVVFTDDNLLEFDAYVFGPADTLYAYKLIKLRFEIPDRYPLVPPKCKFIQHSGGRIHPNLYVEGKVCLSILGTWPGEPWALAMSVETVLITVRSLLDNSPYKHEPHQFDNPDFNRYVQYTTWTSLLLDYLKHESNKDAKALLEKHVLQNSSAIVDEIKRQQKINARVKQFTSVYDRSKVTIANYDKLLKNFEEVVRECQTPASIAPLTIQGFPCPACNNNKYPESPAPSKVTDEAVNICKSCSSSSEKTTNTTTTKQEQIQLHSPPDPDPNTKTNSISSMTQSAGTKPIEVIDLT